jgi:hypothetical protein
MRYQLGLLATLTLGTLSLALAACNDQPLQPSATDAGLPVAAATAPAPDTWIPRAPDTLENYIGAVATVPNAVGQSIVYVIGDGAAAPPRA